MDFNYLIIEDEFNNLEEIINKRVSDYLLTVDVEYTTKKESESKMEFMLIISMKQVSKKTGTISHLPIGYYIGDIGKEVSKEEKKVVMYCNNLLMKHYI